MTKQLPIISIIGRANVGKSTLFNLLVKNKVIISRIPGTTRDTNYQEAEWQGREFIVVDTGGLEKNIYTETKKGIVENLKQSRENEIDKKITEKTKKAVKDSDLILFLVDTKVGIMPQDKEFATFLKKNKLPYILVANKCDNKKTSQQVDEFYKLGLGEPIKISSASGARVGDLLDLVIKKAKVRKTRINLKKTKPEVIKITFIGKTNVGKSSIVNSILKEDKTIVSDQEHTTRDIQLIPFKYNDSDFMLIDTAGIRKNRNQIKKDELEFKSVNQTQKAIKETDIIILVTDVSKNLSVNDLKFSKLIESAQKGLIILANKWDLIDDKDLKTYNEYLKYYKITMPYLMWAKVIPISATKNIRLTKILDEAIIIYKKLKQEISKEDLHKFLQEILRIHKPTIGRGAMKPKIKEIRQVSTNPQTFEVVIGARMSLNNSYLKFISKKIREKFDFRGVPVITYVRKLKNIT
jgi:GTPase